MNFSQQEIQQHTEMLVEQITALAWIRCVQEEGVDFVNKSNGLVESDEMAILSSFQQNLGYFDMPKANASPLGFEKNLLEVLGGYLLYGEDSKTNMILNTNSFKEKLMSKLSIAKSKG